MRKVFAVTLAVLLGLGVVGAWAGELAGKIKDIDQNERSFTLEDGSKVWVAEGVAMDALKEGSSVKASYEDRDGKMVATVIEVSAE